MSRLPLPLPLLLLLAGCPAPTAAPPPAEAEAAGAEKTITLTLPTAAAPAAEPPPVRYAPPAAPTQPALAEAHRQITGASLDTVPEGRARAEAWLREHPEDVEALFLVGHSFIRERRWADASASLERVVAQSPDHHEARKDYAGALLSQGDCTRGMPHLDVLLDVGITAGGELHYMRSYCRKLSGDLRGAKADAEAACAENYPKSCRISKWLDGRIAAQDAAQDAAPTPPPAP